MATRSPTARATDGADAPAVVLCFWLLLLLAGAVFAAGLSGVLVLDDRDNLMPLEDLERGTLSWREALKLRSWAPSGRPVAMLSFLANVLASGLDVVTLKRTNIAIHLLAGTVLFWLAGRLFAQGRLLAPRRWWWALAVAALWLLSPLFVSTVLYVVQRMAQLAALFAFCGLLAYVVGRQNLERRFGLGAAAIASSFLVFWPAAALSKQNGALLPLLLLCVEAYWFGWAGTPRTRALLRLAFVAALGGPFALAVFRFHAEPEWLLGGYRLARFSLAERLLTEGRILWDYVANLVLPRGAYLGLVHDDYVLSKGLLDPPTTLPALLLWGAVSFLAWRLRRHPLLAPAGFGVAFFLAGHLLESTFIPLELYFEHRNYLPGAGIYVALVAALAALGTGLGSRRLVAAFLWALPLLFAVSAWQRALGWRSFALIARVAEQAHPDSARLQTELASLYAQAGEVERAVAHLDRADEIEARPGSGSALHRVLAYCVGGRGEDEALRARLERVRELDGDAYTMNALRLLAELYDKGGCAGLPARTLVPYLRLWYAGNRGLPGRRSWLAHVFLAQILRVGGEYYAALAHLGQAWEEDPNDATPGLLMLRYQAEGGDLQGAARTLARLRRLEGATAFHRAVMGGYERWLRERAGGAPAGSAPR